MLDYEICDLIILIEAKSNKSPVEKYSGFLFFDPIK